MGPTGEHRQLYSQLLVPSDRNRQDVLARLELEDDLAFLVQAKRS